jgi:hypothetical protein
MDEGREQTDYVGCRFHDKAINDLGGFCPYDSK